jgi:hypothetical protein
MCLRVGDLDGVQEEHKQFILVQAEECPTSSKEGRICIIFAPKCLWQGLQAGERGGIPRSQDESGVRVCDSTGALARSRRVECSCDCVIV